MCDYFRWKNILNEISKILRKLEKKNCTANCLNSDNRMQER